MDEAEPDLKVTDRRHFTAEGELREPDLSAGERKASAAPDTARPSPPPETADAPPVSLSSFLLSLATQAADFLGGEERDLGAARQVISALEMLKDKTEGRRTEEESRILDAILFDLRLAFVGAVKGPKP